MKTVNFFASPSYSLTNVQFSQFIADHLQHFKLISKEEMKDEDILKLIATLTALLGDYDKVLVKVTKSAISDRLKQLDGVRDVSYRAFRSALKTESYSTDPDMVNAVHEVEALLHPYGNVAHLILEEETRAIDAIVEALEGPKYHPLIEKIGISAKVNRLKSDNEVFKSTYNARTSEYMAREAADNHALRCKVNEAYTSLSDYAVMMARLEKGPVYDRVVTIINTIRSKYAAQEQRSASHKKKAPKKDEAKDTKPSDVKPTDAKPSDTKPSDPKPEKKDTPTPDTKSDSKK